MNFIGVIGSKLQSIHKIILDTGNSRDPGTIEVIGAIGIQLQHLADTKVVNKPDPQPVEGLPQMLRIHCRATKGLGMKMTVDHGGIGLSSTIKAVVFHFARPEMRQRMIRCGQFPPVELRGWRHTGGERGGHHITSTTRVHRNAVGATQK